MTGTFNGPVRARSLAWRRLNAVARQAVLRGVTRPWASNLIVNEYPKSGGSWLSQMLAEATGLPFPRMRLPMLRSCLMQTHTLDPRGMRDVVVIWRDGRDVMVSYYHHLVIGQESSPPSHLAWVRRELEIADPSDVRGNLPRFIERMMTDPLSPRFTWPRFVKTWHGRPDVVETRYEDFLVDPAAELARVVEARTGEAPDAARITTIVERYSFAAQSGRVSGEAATGKFLRKGVAGDWVNHFTPEAEATFERHAAAAQRTLGYGGESS